MKIKSLIPLTATLLSMAILLSVFVRPSHGQGGQSSVVRFGANLPTCGASTRNQGFIKTSAPVGFYICSPDNLWHGFGAGTGNQVAVYDSTGAISVGDTLLTDASGNLTYAGANGMFAKAFTSTNNSFAGGWGFGQGPSNPAQQCGNPLVNCVGWQAPANIPNNGFFTMPALLSPGVMHFSVPASGILAGSMSGDSNHSITPPLTGQTISQSTATLCAAASGGCNTAGVYVVFWTIRSTTACATPGPANLTLTIGWTDDVGAKTFVVTQNGTGSSGTSVNLGSVSNFGQGTFAITSSGAQPITYSTTYAGCTSGTATYNLSMGTMQLD